MPTPDYILELRAAYGPGRLLLPGVSAVLVRDDLTGPGRRQLLLTRRTDNGRWSLPAGIVEPGEQPAATIVREVLEETRVVARAVRLALVSTDPELTYPNGDVCQFVSMAFHCAYVSGEAGVGDEESAEVGWFDTEDLPGDLSAEQLRRISCGLPATGECVFDR